MKIYGGELIPSGSTVTLPVSALATTGSNIFNGNQITNGNKTINGNLIVTGSLTAQQYIVSSSVTYLTQSFASGSNVFGNSGDDTQQFTGSVSISGSQSLVGNLTVAVAGSTEFQVQQAGVTMGNAVTDTHRVTGSLNVSGSITSTSSVTAQGVNVGVNALGTDRMFQVSGTAFTSGTSQFGIVNNPTMGTPTTIYGYYGGVNVTSATNAYGVYITGAGGTITNKFGIYQEGSGDKNYFAGNVGIGTTSPTQLLTLGGAATVQMSIISNSTTGASEIYFGSPTAVYRGYLGYNHNGDYMNFHTNAGEKMRITSAGNVGIGMFTPGVKLEVYGAKQTISSTDNGVVNITDSSGYAANSGGSLVFRGIYDSAGNTCATGFIDTLKDNGTSGNYGYSLVFGSRSYGSATIERMRINSSGYVGIGTTNFNSSSALTVEQDNLNIVTIRRGTTNSNTTAGRILFQGNNASGVNQNTAIIEAGLDNSATNGYIAFYAGTAAINLKITSAGTVQPGANGTQDLGTASLRWGTIYTSDLSLSNGIGDYTIVEGEEKLYLYNNKNNKVYSFVLHEEDPATATPKKS